MKSPNVLLLALVAALVPAFAGARELPKSVLESYEPWDETVVHDFERILVQEGGRVKPIYTVARFTLMQFSGKSTAKFQTKDGTDHSLHYAEWMLDTLFRGEVAKDIPVFVVDDSEAVVRIGVSPKEKKRTVYSYNDLLPGRSRLAELAAEYADKQRRFEQGEKRDKTLELDRIEGMVLALGQNVSSFEYLVSQFAYARDGSILVNESILPPELIELAKKTGPADMLAEMPLPEMTVDQLVGMMQQPPAPGEEGKMLQDVFRLFFFFANTSRGLFLFPPPESDDEVWLSSSDVMLRGLASKDERDWAVEQLRSVEKLVDARNESPEAFSTAITEFVDWQHSISDPRGEGERADLEIQLYRGKWFTNALVCFILAFVVMAFGWLAPGSKFGKAMVLIASLLALVGFVLDVYGITLRSIIRDRPPITNLYDTVIFITATAVLLGLLIELFTRIGVGTLVAVLSGVIGMFLSIKYEAKEATDTITQLVAVLDTNFWLATHVTIINIGYAAGLVAAIIGIIYLAGRFSLSLMGRESKDTLRTLTRMNYGVICFCLFFSLVGTVLGGIWANYSWGRFWGWDPKENGALMICLWTLVILHGRMAGWIRDLGVHMNAIVLAIITTFSWWGVNNLGVGLHSYGFTEGVWGALYTSWGVMGIFMAMGVYLWFDERRKKADKRQSTVGKEATAGA